MINLPAAPDSNFNYNYRPQSYFFPMGLDKYLLATVQGTERRRDIEKFIKDGCQDEIPDWLAHSALDNITRQLIGKVHPRFMGGEYLPKLKKREVEIGRIELASVTSDVISIRARRGKNRIYYRVVDEYETDYVISPQSSKYLLSLEQLIRLIETATDREHGDHSLGVRSLDRNYRLYFWELEDSWGFTRVTSAFYPELESYYDCAIQHWYQNCQLEQTLDKDEESPKTA